MINGKHALFCKGSIKRNCCITKVVLPGSMISQDFLNLTDYFPPHFKTQKGKWTGNIANFEWQYPV